jgi:hypothetical protein
MRRLHQTSDVSQASDADDPAAVPFDRGYLTDGKALFHIERTLVGSPHGELLVELEDCGTLDLIVCSARAVAELGMRPVQPLTRIAAERARAA